MQINRHTYEEFFLLYNDGELSMEERRAVEDFVRENPDLGQELSFLQQAVFTPDESVVFENKEVLYRRERKVVALPWLRIAAAAVVLFTLSAAGWLYLSNNNDIPKPVMASKELVRDEQINSPTLNKVEPSVGTVTDVVETPSERIVVAPQENRTSVVLTINTNPYKPVPPRAMPEKEADESPVTGSTANIERSKPDFNAVDPAERTNEIMDVAVAPRDLEKENRYSPASQDNAVEYVKGEEQEMIYFANTSLPKKSKFRGVFRKATRFIDKVTSIQ